MKYVRLISILFAALSCICADASFASQTTDQRPVVLELFESEGCSDCPAAEVLFTKLIQERPVKGARIIPIEEHVTYFNNPAHWVDPFSSTQVTDRQFDYAARFKDDSPYTPEMVVNGTAHFVGSDESAAIQAIADAAKSESANVHISVSSSQTDELNAEITVTDVPSSLLNKKVSVVLAVTEDGLVSHVTGGENSGRTLSHIAVTRSLSFLGYLTQNGSNAFRTSISLAKDWRRHPLYAVAFVQDTVSKQISGADETPLDPPASQILSPKGDSLSLTRNRLR